MARSQVAFTGFTGIAVDQQLWNSGGNGGFDTNFVSTNNSAAYFLGASGDTVRPRWGADSSHYYAGTFSADQYSEATLSVIGTDVPGVTVRNSTDTGANRDYYVAYLELVTGTTYAVHIAKVVNGAGRTSDLNTPPSVTFSNGDKLALHAVGSNLSVYKNWTGSGDAAIATATDTDLTTGNPGIFGNEGGTGTRFDYWSGGDIVADGAPSYVPRAMLLGVD